MNIQPSTISVVLFDDPVNGTKMHTVVADIVVSITYPCANIHAQNSERAIQEAVRQGYLAGLREGLAVGGVNLEVGS